MANRIKIENTNDINEDTNNGNGLANNSLPDAGNNNGNRSVLNLRDVLKNLNKEPEILTGERGYDQIIEMIRCFSLQDDGIKRNRKIKSIEDYFCAIVYDDSTIRESINYINNKSLENGDIAQKFAIVFSSNSIDSLTLKETKMRNIMIQILQMNFENADAYREHDKNRLYNSIILLSEYYHRVRILENNVPIIILGESLLNLLTRELSDARITGISARLARLLLSQMTLNGHIMRIYNKASVTQLLNEIRRALIDQQSLKRGVKAHLLKTLDMYHISDTNTDRSLSEFYSKYLAELREENEDNNNGQNQMPSEEVVQAQQQHEHDHEPAENPTSQLVEAQLSNFDKSINLSSSGAPENE